MPDTNSKEVVQRYYDALQSGDFDTAIGLFADDVSWWVLPSSPMAGLYEGKPAVLEMFSRATGLYAANEPLRIEILHLTAEEDRCAAEIRIRARTARGDDYENYYHFLFFVRDGRIVHVREYVDTLYAQRTLFAAGD